MGKGRPLRVRNFPFFVQVRRQKAVISPPKAVNSMLKIGQLAVYSDICGSNLPKCAVTVAASPPFPHKRQDETTTSPSPPSLHPHPAAPKRNGPRCAPRAAPQPPTACSGPGMPDAGHGRFHRHPHCRQQRLPHPGSPIGGLPQRRGGFHGHDLQRVERSHDLGHTGGDATPGQRGGVAARRVERRRPHLHSRHGHLRHAAAPRGAAQDHLPRQDLGRCAGHAGGDAGRRLRGHERCRERESDGRERFLARAV